jgi:hypothetical protein
VAHCLMIRLVLMQGRQEPGIPGYASKECDVWVCVIYDRQDHHYLLTSLHGPSVRCLNVPSFSTHPHWGSSHGMVPV